MKVIDNRIEWKITKHSINAFGWGTIYVCYNSDLGSIILTNRFLHLMHVMYAEWYPCELYYKESEDWAGLAVMMDGLQEEEALKLFGMLHDKKEHLIACKIEGEWRLEDKTEHALNESEW